MPVFTGAATVQASPHKVSAVFVDPQKMKDWFERVNSVETTPDWPKEGAKRSWTLGKKGKTKFESVIIVNRLPKELIEEVRTPSGRSRIEHRFDALPGNTGTKYTKTVDTEYKGMSKIFTLLLNSALKKSVQTEVERVAKLAEEMQRRAEEEAIMTGAKPDAGARTVPSKPKTAKKKPSK